MPSTQSFNALDLVKHVLHLVALREAGSFPSSNPWTHLAVYGLNDVSRLLDVPFLHLDLHLFRSKKQ